MDIVFTTCSSVSSVTGLGKDCSINIAFNQQLPLCSSSTEQETKKGVKVCRQPDNLCTADPSFKFDLSDTPDNDVCSFVAVLSITIYIDQLNRASRAFHSPTSSNPKACPWFLISRQTHPFRCRLSLAMLTLMDSLISY